VFWLVILKAQLNSARGVLADTIRKQLLQHLCYHNIIQALMYFQLKLWKYCACAGVPDLFIHVGSVTVPVVLIALRE